jgi:two-component system cell cycle response regulator
MMRILLADADRAERNGLAATLEQWGYEVVLALDGEGAWTSLQSSDAPRLVLLGAGLARRTAADVCRGLRDLAAEAYVIYLAPRGDAPGLNAALEAGADDFLYRPFDEHELKARLRTGRRVVDLMQAARDARDAFQYQARHDQVTATLNRGAILDVLRHELARSQRERTAVGLVALEVDGFRSLNEAHGPQGGDAVLREITRRLTGLARPYDSLGRCATSEFLLVLPGCDLARAATLGERIRTAVSGTPVRLPGGEIKVTVSVGATSAQGDAAADALANAALNAAHAASASGGDTVQRGAESAP